MAELLVFGSFWFWILVIVEMVLLFAFVINDKAIGGFVSLAVFAGILQFTGGADILGAIAHNPLATLGFLAGYIFMGVVWACIKWTLLSVDNAVEAAEYRDRWLKDRKKTLVELTVEDKEQFKRDLARECPKVVSDGRYMNKFVRWMLFWWISILITVFSDFLIRICRNIYHMLQGFLQSITDKIWAKYGFEKD